MEKTPIFIPKTVKRILFLLHGYGSNGDDMLSVGQSLNLTDTAIICPNGVNEMGYGGYNWFPLDEYDFMGQTALQSMTKQAISVVPKIQSQMMAFCHRYQVRENQVIIGGFSQGGLVGLSVALMTKGIQKAIGMSAVPCWLDDIKVINRPSVLLTHGKADPVVPIQGALFHAKELGKEKVPVEVCLSPYLEHGVDEMCIQKIRQFCDKS